MRGRTHPTKWLLCVLLLWAAAHADAAGRVIYVDAEATGPSDGTSWAAAYASLQDALAKAQPGDEIRVASGIYKPDQGAGIRPWDRNASFQLIDGVILRGGFAGVGSADPDARNVEIYETILSGDLAGNDIDVIRPSDLSDEATRSDNSPTIVSINDSEATIELDGLTVTSGSTGIRKLAAGSLSVSNCTFRSNSSVAIFNGRGELTMTDCIFQSNEGHAVSHWGDNLTARHCLFEGNWGTTGAGLNCIALYSEVMLRDCIFTGNVAVWDAALNCSAGRLELDSCKFTGNVAQHTCLGATVQGDFVAEKCIFTGNIGGAIDHDSGRLIFSNCLIAGNRGQAIKTHGRYVKIQNCTFSDNHTDIDGSALDSWNAANVSNSIFWGNSSPVIKLWPPAALMMDFCEIEGGWPGVGNINVDPGFVAPGHWDLNGTPADPDDDFWVDGDYHLLSQAGRWDPVSESWVRDDVTSPCIDACDPNSPIGTEPFPNGGRSNMGAYGASETASKTYFGSPPCAVILAGDINGDCVVNLDDLAILMSHWMMRSEDFVNKPPVVTLIEPQDGDQIIWPGPTMFRAEAHDPDGEVKQVIFYLEQMRDNGGRRIGFSGSEGFNGWERGFDWQRNPAIPEGNWTVWAEATDNDGVVGVSAKITITLHRPDNGQ